MENSQVLQLEMWSLAQAKLYLSVDTETQVVIAAEVSLNMISKTNNEVLPALQNPLWHKIKLACPDDAYDPNGCHELLQKIGQCHPNAEKERTVMSEGASPQLDNAPHSKSVYLNSG